MTDLNSSTDILLVERNPEVVRTIGRALRQTHPVYSMTAVATGAAALEYLLGEHRRKPKLILVDLKVEKINGLELLRRLRLESHTRRLPIVVLTASREQADVEEAYRLGANSYIAKPEHPEQLVQLIHSITTYWLEHNLGPR